MRKQHRWIRQQLICCFIHTYTQAHRLPPTVREIGAWVGCPGMRSLYLADLERQQYLTRQSHAQRSILLTAKGIAPAERWQLFVPVAGANAQTRQALAQPPHHSSLRGLRSYPLGSATSEQVYEARKNTQGRASIRKRSEVGKHPAWPDGFPNRMPYFFGVLESILGLKAGQQVTRRPATHR